MTHVANTETLTLAHSQLALQNLSGQIRSYFYANLKVVLSIRKKILYSVLNHLVGLQNLSQTNVTIFHFALPSNQYNCFNAVKLHNFRLTWGKAPYDCCKNRCTLVWSPIVGIPTPSVTTGEWFLCRRRVESVGIHGRYYAGTEQSSQCISPGKFYLSRILE